MPDHYHDPSDRQYNRALREGAPREWDAFINLDNVVGFEDGVIPHKYRELIAVAVALTTQCAYCIEAHSTAAQKAGVTKEELAEAVFLAAALRAGGGFAHGRMAMKFFEQAGKAPGG
mgnify:CR=1 FL=1